MPNGTLAGASGFAQGFASTFVPGIQAAQEEQRRLRHKKEREAAIKQGFINLGYGDDAATGGALLASAGVSPSASMLERTQQIDFMDQYLGDLGETDPELAKSLSRLPLGAQQEYVQRVLLKDTDRLYNRSLTKRAAELRTKAVNGDLSTLPNEEFEEMMYIGQQLGHFNSKLSLALWINQGKEKPGQLSGIEVGGVPIEYIQQAHEWLAELDPVWLNSQDSEAKLKKAQILSWLKIGSEEEWRLFQSLPDPSKYLFDAQDLMMAEGLSNISPGELEYTSLPGEWLRWKTAEPGEFTNEALATWFSNNTVVDAQEFMLKPGLVLRRADEIKRSLDELGHRISLPPEIARDYIYTWARDMRMAEINGDTIDLDQVKRALVQELDLKKIEYADAIIRWYREKFSIEPGAAGQYDAWLEAKMLLESFEEAR
jgi:hypothetical protein